MKMLEIAKIRRDGGTQPRSEIDMVYVAECVGEIERGVEFPPVDVFFDGSEYWLADGFHRAMAYEEAEKNVIPTIVHQGSVEDAKWFSLGANKSHGLRRTNEDKRRAVKLALEMKPDESAGIIAEHVGVSKPTVSKVKEEIKNGYRPNRNSFTTLVNSGGVKDLHHPKEQQKATQTKSVFVERPVEFPCKTCGERFSFPVWHCPSCDHHWGDEETECKNCRSNGLNSTNGEHGHDLADDEPVFQLRGHDPAPRQYITLDEWNRLSESEQQECFEAKYPPHRFNDQKDNDNIEWALWSWNPVTGCLHNCPYCYARDIANRFYEQQFQPSLIPGRLKDPHNTPFPTEKAAEWIGHKNVFTCSMADLFGRWVPKEWINAVLREIADAPQWNFLFLTKFPSRMAEFKFPDNAWVGTSVDCQARVKNAEKAFRKVKASVKWLSCEPLIEPLRFSDIGAFDWIVLGGASRSTQTPEWRPPRHWVDGIEEAAINAGVKVYEKTNLLRRIRQYPGVDDVGPTEAPASMRYLPTDIS